MGRIISYTALASFGAVWFEMAYADDSPSVNLNVLRKGLDALPKDQRSDIRLDAHSLALSGSG